VKGQRHMVIILLSGNECNQNLYSPRVGLHVDKTSWCECCSKQLAASLSASQQAGCIAAAACTAV